MSLISALVMAFSLERGGERRYGADRGRSGVFRSERKEENVRSPPDCEVRWIIGSTAKATKKQD